MSIKQAGPPGSRERGARPYPSLPRGHPTQGITGQVEGVEVSNRRGSSPHVPIPARKLGDNDTHIFTTVPSYQ